MNKIVFKESRNYGKTLRREIPTVHIKKLNEISEKTSISVGQLIAILLDFALNNYEIESCKDEEN